jgi:thymidylate synthase
MNSTKQYHDLLQYVLDNGKLKQDRTSTSTLSIFDYSLKLDLLNDFPIITTKKLHLKSIIHELLWFLKGDTNVKYLNKNSVTIWNEWADENGELGPIYGKQWVDWGGWFSEGHADSKGGHGRYFNGINQIKEAIDILKSSPDSRRILINAWNVGELKDMKLPPCHWAFELYSEELTEEERKKYWCMSLKKSGYYAERLDHEDLDKVGCPRRRLSMKWHQRSVDSFLGLPFNMASYGFLLKMISIEVGMFPGQLIGDLTNVHIYRNHVEYAMEQLERDPHIYASPEVLINFGDVSNKGKGFKKSIFDIVYDDFYIGKYEAYPNWKKVPIAI